jgi:prepilin-type N-terminal cleavage/methylation domain-containing protein
MMSDTKPAQFMPVSWRRAKRMPGQFPPKTNLGQRHETKGFTLLELLIVLAIIAVLATISLPIYNSYLNKAKITVAVSTLEMLRKTLEVFHIDYAEYPIPPVGFTTNGLDGNGRRALLPEQVNQLSEDLFSIDSYVLAGNVYTIIARAKDSNHTVITLTQQGITH